MSGTVWIEVRAIFDTEPADWSPFADAFDRHGCPGSIISEKPPGISGYLVSVDAAKAQVALLRNELFRLGALDVQTAEVPEEDWSESWRKFFKPRRIGKRIVVRPTWEPFEAGAEDIEIVLDPGQAFGTGDHQTTRLCLELLETAELDGRSVLDLGCGSGILSIAAAKLGAARVLGVDIEPVSVEVAQRNAEQNQVASASSRCPEAVATSQQHGDAGRSRRWFPSDVTQAGSLCYVDFLCADGFSDPRLNGPWDVIVSNIISATLIRLAPEVSQRLKPGGVWIVSGIIRQNWEDVQAAAKSAGFALQSERAENDWVASKFTRGSGTQPSSRKAREDSKNTAPKKRRHPKN